MDPHLIAEIIFSTGQFRALAELLAGHQGAGWVGDQRPDQVPEPQAELQAELQAERLVTFLLRACAVDTHGSA